jgi:hypothetical protein
VLPQLHTRIEGALQSSEKLVRTLIYTMYMQNSSLVSSFHHCCSAGKVAHVCTSVPRFGARIPNKGALRAVSILGRDNVDTSIGTFLSRHVGGQLLSIVNSAGNPPASVTSIMPCRRGSCCLSQPHVLIFKLLVVFRMETLCGM